MTIVMKDCVANNCGEAGTYIGKGMNVTIIGGNTNNNKIGVAVHKDSIVHIENHESSNNTLYGYYSFDSDLLGTLGLPNNTDKMKLELLFNELRVVEPTRREEIIYSSFLSATLATLADASTVVVNILNFINTLPSL
jgi:hypothetical protein